MSSARSLGCAWLVLMLAALGCNSDAVVGKTATTTAALCGGACEHGQVCSGKLRKCVGCVTSADCGDGGAFCDDHTHACVECRTRADCAAGLACVASACVACTTTAQCGSAAECEDGRCKSNDMSGGSDDGMAGSSGGDDGS